MSCQSQCDSVHIQYQVGAPDSVVYEICGFPPGGCIPTPICMQTKVYFVNDKTATMNPTDAMVCFGNNDATLTANGTGGKPPYQYVWNTGETTQVIQVGQGTYSVEIFDETSCPTSMDTVEVGAFLFPIIADAGPDTSYSSSIISFQLQGTIQEALGGVWSGGDAAFTPDEFTLNAVYIPTPTEIINGVTLTLTTTGNRSCPGAADQVTITFGRQPVINTTINVTACQNNPTIELSATVTDVTGVEWSSADGSFSPNTTNATVDFTGNSTAVFINNSAIVTVTSTGNANCSAVSETITITYTPSPTIATTDITTCSNNPIINLNATYTLATGVEWFGNGTFSSTNIDNPSYIATNTELTYTQATVYVQTTGNGGCRPAFDSVVIDFTPAPEIVALTNPTICISDTDVSLSVSTTNADDVSWSGGEGSFSPITGLTTTYTFGGNDKLTNPLLLDVSTTNLSGCLDVTTQLAITFDPLTTVNAGDDIIVCKNNAIINLNATAENTSRVNWISEGTGSFSNSKELNTIYTTHQNDVIFNSIEYYILAFPTGLCRFAIDTLVLNLQIRLLSMQVMM